MSVGILTDDLSRVGGAAVIQAIYYVWPWYITALQDFPPKFDKSSALILAACVADLTFIPDTSTTVRPVSSATMTVVVRPLFTLPYHSLHKYERKWEGFQRIWSTTAPLCTVLQLYRNLVQQTKIFSTGAQFQFSNEGSKGPWLLNIIGQSLKWGVIP